MSIRIARCVRPFVATLVIVSALSACGATAPLGPDGDVVDAASVPSVSPVVDASPRVDASRPVPLPDAGTDAAADATRDAADASIACPICTYPTTPVSGGNVASAGLVEISGIAASRVHTDVLYAHNDSGDVSRIFMMGADGTEKNVVSVTGATAVDWEDIAVGPCPSGSCVFVGDIGDNGKSRTDIVLYRMPEPSLTATSVSASAYPLQYPDGPHDAETLLVDGAGAVYVVTKETLGAVQLFAFGIPAAPGTTMIGRSVARITPPTLGIPAVTGGDFFGGPCPRMLLRTYAGVLLFEGIQGEGPTELARRGYRTLRAPLEQQGEAIAFSADGKSIFTASEGTSVPVHRYSCGP